MAWPIVVNNVSATFGIPSNAGYGCGIKFKQYFDNINDQRWSGIAGVSQGQYSNYTGLAFYTCNNYVTTEKMRILHNGNVGIGTTSPNTALEIHGGALSGDEVLILSNSKDSGFTGLQGIFRQGGHHYDVYNSSTIQLDKSTSNGTTFYINHYSAGDVCMATGGGNVGIGIADPKACLNIVGKSTFRRLLFWIITFA